MKLKFANKVSGIRWTKRYIDTEDEENYARIWRDSIGVLQLYVQSEGGGGTVHWIGKRTGGRREECCKMASPWIG